MNLSIHMELVRYLEETGVTQRETEKILDRRLVPFEATNSYPTRVHQFMAALSDLLHS